MPARSARRPRSRSASGRRPAPRCSTNSSTSMSAPNETGSTGRACAGKAVPMPTPRPSQNTLAAAGRRLPPGALRSKDTRRGATGLSGARVKSARPLSPPGPRRARAIVAISRSIYCAMRGRMTAARDHDVDRRDHRQFLAARRVGRPLSLCDRAWPRRLRRCRDATAAKPTRCRAAPARSGSPPRCMPDGAAGPVLRFVGDSDAHIVRGLIAILFALYSGKPRARHSDDRCDRAVRAARPARASHAAALERLPLHGRAHQVGRAGGAGDRGLTAAFTRSRQTAHRRPARSAPARAPRRAPRRCSRSDARAGRGRAAARPWRSAAASRVRARRLRGP